MHDKDEFTKRRDETEKKGGGQGFLPRNVHRRKGGDPLFRK